MDLADCCQLVVAPREAAAGIETAMSASDTLPGAVLLPELHLNDVVCLGCVLEGADPNAPWEPRRGRHAAESGQCHFFVEPM